MVSDQGRLPRIKAAIERFAGKSTKILHTGLCVLLLGGLICGLCHVKLAAWDTERNLEHHRLDYLVGNLTLGHDSIETDSSYQENPNHPLLRVWIHVPYDKYLAELGNDNLLVDNGITDDPKSKPTNLPKPPYKVKVYSGQVIQTGDHSFTERDSGTTQITILPGQADLDAIGKIEQFGSKDWTTILVPAD